MDGAKVHWRGRNGVQVFRHRANPDCRARNLVLFEQASIIVLNNTIGSRFRNKIQIDRYLCIILQLRQRQSQQYLGQQTIQQIL